MVIPLSMINFEVYDNGERMLGLASCDLAEIEISTTDIKGAGILGTVSWPVKGNFSNFATTFHWLTLTETGAKFLNQSKGYVLSLRGAQEAYDAATGERKVVPVRVDVRAHTTKLSLGKFEVGEQTETELEFMLDFIKVSIGGKEVLSVDKFNYQAAVNGEDYLSDVKEALGI